MAVNNKLYILSPTGFRALGVVFILLAAAFILLFFLDALKRNKRQIEEHRQELAEQATATTTYEDDPDGEGVTAVAPSEASSSSSKTVAEDSKAASIAALMQTLAFGLWAVLCHLSIFRYINLTMWPFYFLFIFAIFYYSKWIHKRYPTTQDHPHQHPHQRNNRQCNSKTQDSDAFLLGLLFAFLAVQFLLAYAQHCFHVAPLAVYDYFGPVRVIGYNQSYIGRDGRQNKLPHLQKYYYKCPVDEAVGQIQVAWGGGDWACGGKKECQAMVHSFHCDFVVCENCNGDGCQEGEYTAALKDSNYCVQNSTLYFKESWDLLELGITYDATVRPEEDEHQFSTEIMYANCDTCEAEFEEIADEQKEGRMPNGAVLLFGGVCAVFGMLYFTTLSAWKRQRNTSQRVPSVQDAAIELS